MGLRLWLSIALALGVAGSAVAEAPVPFTSALDSAPPLVPVVATTSDLAPFERLRIRAGNVICPKTAQGAPAIASRYITVGRPAAGLAGGYDPLERAGDQVAQFLANRKRTASQRIGAESGPEVFCFSGINGDLLGPNYQSSFGGAYWQRWRITVEHVRYAPGTRSDVLKLSVIGLYQARVRNGETTIPTVGWLNAASADDSSDGLGVLCETFASYLSGDCSMRPPA